MLSTYLARRAGGVYYFRRAVPEPLRQALEQRREWVMSLRTTDRRTAKCLIPQYANLTDRIVQWAQAGDARQVQPQFEWLVSDPDGRFAEIQVRSTVQRGVLSLLTVFEEYADEQHLKGTIKAEWRAMLSKFVTFCGSNNIKRIKRSDIEAWCAWLLKEQRNGELVRQAITVKGKYLTCLRATLAWACEKRLMNSNPAADVVIRVPRAVRLRAPDFTDDEAGLILRATLMAHPDIRPELALVRRWVPWLCAFTGARVNEISQIRVEDVQTIDGIHVIRITPEAGTVKNLTARVIPLHQEIIRQGFLEEVGRLPTGPVFYDPGRQKTSHTAGRYMKKVGEHLCDWVRSGLKIDDPALQPNHAWRHRFKTTMRELGVPERVADFIQGHAPRSVGQSYGTVPLKVMKRYIDLMPVPSLMV